MGAAFTTLSVTTANANRSYGQTNPAFTGTTSGITNGDNLSANYFCNAVTNSPVGAYSIVPTLVDPGNRQTNYTVNLINGTLIVDQTSPSILWTNPVSVVYGTSLGIVQLNAKANVAGTYAYTPANGTTLNVGTNALSVVFTPSDAPRFQFNCNDRKPPCFSRAIIRDCRQRGKPSVWSGKSILYRGIFRGHERRQHHCNLYL